MDIYKQTSLATKEFMTDVIVHQNKIEKDFIVKFLSQLPLEKLKILTNFSMFDYKNEHLINKSINDEHLRNKLIYLRNIKSIEMNVEIKI